MGHARIPPSRYARILVTLRKLEALVVVKKPKALEDRSKDGLCNSEIFKQIGASRAMLHQETVEILVEIEELGVVIATTVTVLVHNVKVSGHGERILARNQHGFDCLFVWGASAQSRAFNDFVEVSQDDQTLLDDFSLRSLDHRQCGCAARLLQDFRVAWLCNVDNPKVDCILPVSQRKEYLQPLGKRADRDVVDDVLCFHEFSSNAL